MESKTVDGETTVFKSLICFKLTFVNGVRWWPNVILLYVDIQFSHHHLLTRLSFPPLNGLGTLVEDHLTVYARVHFLILCRTDLYACLYAGTILFWLPQLWNKFVNLEVWDLLLFLKINLSVGVCSYSILILGWFFKWRSDFHRNCIKSVDSLGVVLPS